MTTPSTTPSTAATSSTAVPLLRWEGATLLVAACLAYTAVGAPWWLFASLLLAPDASMVGYLRGPRAGSALYNAVHTTIVPLALLAAGLWLEASSLLPYGLIWLAHIGMDRALGFGLKLPSGFHHTHLSTTEPRSREGAPRTDATVRRPRR